MFTLAVCPAWGVWETVQCPTLRALEDELDLAERRGWRVAFGDKEKGMLVLSRSAKRDDNTVLIGEGPDAIRLIVLSVGEGRVRIGVEADRNVPVLRGELLPGSLDDVPEKQFPRPRSRDLPSEAAPSRDG